MGASLKSSSRKSRGRRSRGAAVMSEINVTPFVDVMLVLLIIFMVAAPLLVAGVQVDLPEAKAKAVEGQDEPLSITVSKKGEVFLNDAKVKIEELVPKLQAITKQNKEARIFVRGDTTVDYGQVMRVLALLTEAGYVKVALLTEQPS